VTELFARIQTAYVERGLGLIASEREESQVFKPQVIAGPASCKGGDLFGEPFQVDDLGVEARRRTSPHIRRDGRALGFRALRGARRSARAADALRADSGPRRQ
jgi:hypothetical protein